MTSKHSTDDYVDDLQTFSVAYAGILGTIVIVVIILMVQMIFHMLENRRWRMHTTEVEFSDADELRTRQLNWLQEHRWLEKGKIATIPIQDAMQQIADEF